MTEAPHLSNAAPEGDWADRMEQTVLDAALGLAPRLGWNSGLLRAACEACGLSRGDEELLLPNGARDLAALLSRRHDDRALAALAEVDAGALKIRERIAAAVSARMEAGAADLEATRRCAAFLALPMNADLGLKLAWESADALWRWAGDVATDENHYSKRAILAGILVPALAIRLRSGEAESDAFLDARIANVMSFEAWKAGRDPGAPLRRLVEGLGRLRYGSSVSRRA